MVSIIDQDQLLSTNRWFRWPILKANTIRCLSTLIVSIYIRTKIKMKEKSPTCHQFWRTRTIWLRATKATSKTVQGPCTQVESINFLRCTRGSRLTTPIAKLELSQQVRSSRTLRLIILTAWSMFPHSCRVHRTFSITHLLQQASS